MNRFLLLILFLPIQLFGQQSIEIDSSQVYLIVEEMPTMKNGVEISDKIKEIIFKEFRYSDSLKCEPISNIIFEFTISYSGKVVNPNVHFPRKNDGCEDDYKKIKEIGINIMNKFTDFKPGKKDGKYVSVRYTIPLHIDMQ